MICSNCWNQGFFLLLDSMCLKMNLREIWLCPNIETSHQHHTQGLLQWRHSEELGRDRGDNRINTALKQIMHGCEAVFVFC